MTDIDLLREEIKELEAQIFRIKNSMNRADNGVKLQKLAVITRLRDRCNRSLGPRKARGGSMIPFLNSDRPIPILSQDACFLRGSFERGPGFRARNHALSRCQASLPSRCVTHALRLGPGFHQECDRLSGAPDDVKTTINLQLNVCIPDGDHRVLRWVGFPQTYIREIGSKGAILGVSLTSSSVHLRRNFLAWYRRNVGGLFRDIIRSWLLDGVLWIWQGIGRFTWWNFHGLFRIFGGCGHIGLLFDRPTDTRPYLYREVAR